jgi:hypothetical protein
LPVVAAPNTNPTSPPEREADDFALRSMVESLIRDGADEDTIVRTLHAVTGSGDPESRASGAARSPLRALQRIVRLAA